MSFELSSIITGLQKEGISVADSAKTCAQRVAAELGKRFAAGQAPDFVGLQLGLARLVQDDLSLLLRTDTTHVRGVVASRLQLRQRNGYVAEVFEVLSNIRGVIGSGYGDAARIELFGDVSALPQDPLALHRLGKRVHDQLLDDSFQLPPVRLAGFTPLDREAVAGGLEQPLGRLGQALADLSLERKDADTNLFDRNEGVDEYRRTVRFAGGCLASLYRLAGFDDLADRIRPKRRASRRGGGPDGGAGQTAGAGGAGESSEGSEPSAEPSAEPSSEPSSNPARGDDGAAPVEASGPIGIVR